MSEPVHVTDDIFESEVLESATPVLVDFWAEWCGPCKAIAPLVEELATEFDGKLKVAKVDVDAAQKYAQQYGVRSIPTLIIFKDGKPVDQIIGAVPKNQLTTKIQAHL
jgi:thioredoxin 1